VGLDFNIVAQKLFAVGGDYLARKVKDELLGKGGETPGRETEMQQGA
jgi:hypothetical protein